MGADLVLLVRVLIKQVGQMRFISDHTVSQ